jgi:SAM-dependent methyltransferase
VTGRGRSQAGGPHGLAGIVFGWLMAMVNGPAYKHAAALIDPQAEDWILETGFGTGHLAARLARATKRGKVCGVDPSDLMVRTAQRRVAGLRADLRKGTADALPWPDATFDKAAALHNFQFWPDPARGLAEVRRALKPGAPFVMILRDHEGKRLPDLPNPISRTGREAEGTLVALKAAGFGHVERLADFDEAPVILARR